MSIYLLSQAFGAVAFLFALYGFINKDDKVLKLCIAASSICVAAHLGLLEAWSGMIISLVAAARYIASSYTKNTWLMAFFMAIGVAYGAYIHTIWSDALPVLANILATFAIFNLSGIKLRATLMVVGCFWISYYTLNYSIVGAASECFYFGVNAYNVWKHKRRPVGYNI
ncbi:MAG: hypothetical protein DI585_02690 [Pseudomonas fluorescens]|nr:MAG: hypothetical protein DI585_02690 [Pseudomonas fluorescens]